ncbi:LysR family transcriptional regulator [Leeia sp. TBRC 13508]|uniref:LysR family transcriptional regulator n=1 Tax=Leeia speluncae TaxID=2884804 RepID=A0ABS8D853_9NEIS|nr:LysR substrate-binding domain-containing protein [Leeia speluncae]MCB6184389.1 LysR family transcriptional regulator [Leeia speluncae]
MDFRQLKYFVTLAEHLHFAKAAEALDIAPSALSMQLQNLESSLGVRLVQRTKRSVSLTTAGKLFLEEARQTLFQIKRTEMLVKQAGRGEIGSLELGYVISAACAGIVQLLISEIRNTAPHLHIGLQALESPTQLQMLEEGKLDACIVRTLSGHTANYEAIILHQEKTYIALPAVHLLATKAALVSSDLINEAFITPQFQQDFGFTSSLAEIGEKAGFTPQVSLPTKDFITTLALVGGGLGIAAVPASICQLKIPNVVYKPLLDIEQESTLTLVTRRHDPNPTIKNLLNIAKKLNNA